MAGSTAMSSSSRPSGTFIDSRTRPRASITPSSSVRISTIAACLSGSSQEARLASRRVVDVRSVSTMRRPLRRSVDPVSVRSTSASTSSGTLASVAP